MATAARAELFKETKSFKAALNLIRQIDDEKFPLLLEKIISQIGMKKTDFFTESESAQLQDMFHLTAEQLTHVVEGCAYVFEQAGYFALKPATFGAQLGKISLAPQKAKAFLDTWTAGAEGVLTRLRERSFGAPPSLTKIGWDLCIPLASSYTRADREVLVRFDLEHIPLPPSSTSSVPANATPPCVVSVTPASLELSQLRQIDMALGAQATNAPSLLPSGQDNHIRFELNHAELRAMLDQMERIQEQLDALA